jgi:hypothetical protein
LTLLDNNSHSRQGAKLDFVLSYLSKSKQVGSFRTIVSVPVMQQVSLCRLRTKETLNVSIFELCHYF